jgi:hypothetical protein
VRARIHGLNEYPCLSSLKAPFHFIVDDDDNIWSERLIEVLPPLLDHLILHLGRGQINELAHLLEVVEDHDTLETLSLSGYAKWRRKMSGLEDACGIAGIDLSTDWSDSRAEAMGLLNIFGEDSEDSSDYDEEDQTDNDEDHENDEDRNSDGEDEDDDGEDADENEVEVDEDGKDKNKRDVADNAAGEATLG